MSWASKRRAAYLSGVIGFFLLVIGGPLLFWWISSIPPACMTGTMRPPGVGSGPCSQLDPRYLQPFTTMWARSFKVRDGTYSAVAYLENPNPSAGVQVAHYKFGLYDSSNVLIADREGATVIMPGQITPVLEPGIDTGNRVVVHTYFQITDPALVWKQSQNPAASIKVNDQQISGLDSAPRIDAKALNTSLDTMRNISFIAVIFDPAGNAFAASGTAIPQLDSNQSAAISFTWPSAFTSQVGRIDIIPILPPAPSGAGAGN